MGREFDSRPPRLVLGWVSVVTDRQTTSVFHQTTYRPTQPPALRGTGSEYRQKCDDALRLGSKGRYGSLHLWINAWVARKTVWSIVNTCQAERFRDEYRTHYKALYENVHVL